MADQVAILVPHTTDIRVGDLSFDLVVSESFTSAVSATAFSREDGSRPSDGAILQPRTTTLECLLTDWAPGAEEAQLGRARDMLEALKELQAWLEPITVYTMLHDYGLVHITNVQARQDAKTGYSIPVSITIESVEVVTQRTVIVPPDAFAKPVKNSAPKTKEGGNKNNKNPSPPAKNKSSLLHKMFY